MYNIYSICKQFTEILVKLQQSIHFLEFISILYRVSGNSRTPTQLLHKLITNKLSANHISISFELLHDNTKNYLNIKMSQRKR